MAEMVFECKFYQVHRANLFIFKGLTQYCVLKFFGRNLVSYNLSSIYNCLGYKFALQCSHGPILPIVGCRTNKGYRGKRFQHIFCSKFRSSPYIRI